MTDETENEEYSGIHPLIDLPRGVPDETVPISHVGIGDEHTEEALQDAISHIPSDVSYHKAEVNDTIIDGMNHLTLNGVPDVSASLRTWAMRHNLVMFDAEVEGASVNVRYTTTSVWALVCGFDPDTEEGDR